MAKQYVVDRSRLLFLEEQAALMKSLQEGGVHNWPDWEKSRRRYLLSFADSLLFHEGIKANLDVFDFGDVARHNLKNYQEVEECDGK